MTWGAGRDSVQNLLHSGDLERVSPNEHLAERLLAGATRHLATSRAGLSTGDLAGAYQLAYDALRKSAAALLAVQGPVSWWQTSRTPSASPPLPWTPWT